MPTSAPASCRARYFSGSSFLLLLVLLVTGCHSTRVAYQFQPPAGAPATGALTTVLPDSRACIAAAAPVPAERQPGKRTVPARVWPTGRQLRQQLRRSVVAARPQLSLRPRPAAQQVRRVAGPRHTTEVGLGTTVLGVLGLVVLPVALLGLLIWGGPVWAILAVLAVLAVLVAYLDPFQ